MPRPIESSSGQPDDASHAGAGQPSGPHRRRPRYSGKYPRRFEEKYKERRPDLYPETVEKVIQSGKTPAGMHRPIMVEEAILALGVKPGKIGVDCTLGFGGHAEAFLQRVRPGGRLLGIDADPLQLPRTEARLRVAGFGPDAFLAFRTNFAGLSVVLAKAQLQAVDFIFADLGVSSMQLDDPARGFSFKAEGPLDMRMNPDKPMTAAILLKKSTPGELSAILRENADEPHASIIGQSLAGGDFPTTISLARSVEKILGTLSADERENCKRRVFQALRIAVNQEFAVLESLLRALPGCLVPGGRVAFLTFHSGEDRRVKQAFSTGLRSGIYQAISENVIRPSAAEIGANPRSKPAKLRWAQRSKRGIS